MSPPTPDPIDGPSASPSEDQQEACGWALEDLLTGSSTSHSALRRLHRAGFPPRGDVVLVASRATTDGTWGSLEGLRRRAQPVGRAQLDSLDIVLVAAEAALVRLGATDEPVGLSRAHPLDGDLQAARREAVLALGVAERSGGGPRRFGAADQLPAWLPDDTAALSDIVCRVLGPAQQYEVEHGLPLVASLQAYFDHDGRLNEAAAALGVHKHTLAYRLRRAEEMIGGPLRSVRVTTDVWLALHALRALGGSRPRPPAGGTP